MGKRQHRCPFYLLKITKNDLEIINSSKKNNNNAIELYERQLNTLSLEYQKLKGILEKIVDIIKPYLDYKHNYTLEEVVNNSLLDDKTKKSTLSLIKKYKTYCNKKLQSNIESKNGKIQPQEIASLYDPKNAFEFVSNHDRKYQRGTIKKNLNTLLRILRLATNNPFLSYEFPIGKGEPSKLKHIITNEELKKFIYYLNSEKYYVMIVICMLMHKFGLRISPLAKLKVRDLLPDDIIIFKEKNNRIIKRKLLPSTSEILRNLIHESELKENDYIFYFFKFANDDNKRSQFFVQKMRNLLHESNCFSITTVESLSSHIFRATYAVNSYNNNKIEMIQSDLGHKYSYTTLNSYINPERRELNLYEEKMKKISGINALKNRISDENKISKKSNIKIIKDEDNSFNIDEEGEDYIDDDIETHDNFFYFTGHFYDDKDIIEYKRQQQQIIEKNNEYEIKYAVKDINLFNPHKKSNIGEISCNTNPREEIKFNDNKMKKTFEKIRNNNIDILGIKDYNDSIDIKESNKNIILLDRIKNKNEIYILNKKEKEILEHTLALNKKGIYNNIKGIKINGNIVIESTNNISNNVLITIFGGLVYYNKNHIKVGKNQINKKEKLISLLYFKTAKSIYDRFIKISQNSIVNFLFPNLKNIRENLDIIKIVDSQNLIKLLVITKRNIKKGEILSLDRNLLV